MTLRVAFAPSTCTLSVLTTRAKCTVPYVHLDQCRCTVAVFSSDHSSMGYCKLARLRRLPSLSLQSSLTASAECVPAVCTRIKS